jgi:hypothetical protein
MAEFHYYGTFDESLAILGDVLSLGGLEALHDHGVRRPEDLPRFGLLTEELKDRLRLVPRYFIVGPFTGSPLSFDVLETGPYAGEYRIQETENGPVLRGWLAQLREIDGLPTLCSGDFGHQRHYWDTRTNTGFWPPDDLKKSYAQIVRRMKRHLVQHQLGKKVWITPGALGLLLAGKARIKDIGVLTPSDRPEGTQH